MCILLYADDTVLLSENPKDLQIALNAMDNYCTNQKLQINTDKTKIMVLSRGKVRSFPDFFFGSSKIEVVSDYQYLGLTFNYNGKFNKAKTKLYEKGNRAMFSLLKKARKMLLPLDILVKLFNTLVKSLLLYGAEIWGDENNDVLEKLQLRFYKYILGLKNLPVL